MRKQAFLSPFVIFLHAEIWPFSAGPTWSRPFNAAYGWNGTESNNAEYGLDRNGALSDSIALFISFEQHANTAATKGKCGRVNPHCVISR